MNLFYTPDIQNKFYQLDEIESKHCVRVLRLKEEDIIHLIDGKGTLYKAKIIDAHPKRCTVECFETKTEFGKLNYKLHIALAPTKNMDRTEWFMEKCTEIGIHEFTPLLCQHSERKVVKQERLFKVITSAVKQSLKAYHPILNEQTKFSDLVTAPYDGEKYIAHCNKGEKTHLKNLYKAEQNALILIGPEGDFSIEEVNLAKENGFQEITLGESRLRTETAGIVACNIISLENQ
ncbi:16S rRNA (uracil(1498)-N(3))-methyltransferase [Labilibaculum antarcticum]|uniref:Ribosomal RNA small subunit methyltransferase E n=1 Tax=Labilibaculum antarcticum TaxID=1717717 RepID=A0A1Y1CGY7_9BACT|nr:16S rRNA (uracil(1498)-N(3))-methyltransferase [Labilibaculum antarcticum]BAX78551.1 16S rRNA (uracil(1498)-N(3))-methyltransferase [Labilibaculum antarcticum]